MKTKLIVALMGLAAVAGLIMYLSQAPKRRNIVLVILDTTRADHLSVYGYERDTTPNLKKFADESIVFDYAVATAPWTPPAIASIMSGLYVGSHGLMPPNSRQLAKKTSTRLDERIVTIAELLKAHGYKTGGVTPNPWTTNKFGFDQGFDQYFFRERARADEINRAAFRVIDSWGDSTEPRFLFVHYLDPHDPYDPPEPFASKYTGGLSKRTYDAETLKNLNLYDGEISFLDARLGELLDFLKSKGMYDDSLIVVVGDHGEQLNERKQTGHGFRLFDEEVHVPLIVHDRGRSMRIDYTVSPVDIFPTILEAANIEVGEALQGISLFKEDALLARAGVLSEINRKYNLRSFVNLEGKKLILGYGGGENDDFELQEEPRLVGVFDRKRDPFELSAVDNKELTQTLRSAFDAALRKVSENAVKASTVQIEEHTLDQLKSMGYLK